MKKQRIPETDHGIRGESTVREFDVFQRGMRDRGLIETDEMIKFGITSGTALEIGSGPGYLGLEWLKKTRGTVLHWLEISADMRRMALENAKEYGLADRITMAAPDPTGKFPFPDGFFDAVFSNGSLHEWADPIPMFNELYRVLKNRGRFHVTDLKRNINSLIVLIMKSMTKVKSMRIGLMTSINASYLKSELMEILSKSAVINFQVRENSFGLKITGTKQ